MSKKKVEEIYQKKTQHEHILSRPDMYIGTIEKVTEKVWWFDEDTNKMRLDELTWCPGLFKIYDEILVNAADNYVRDNAQTRIDVTINEEQGWIRVKNDGQGIPVEIHKEHNMYVPAMIFGHLLTSSHYDDKEARVTGGRNGFGAKLTNVFSRRFDLETVCRGKMFKMRWTRNMLEHGEPVISNVSDQDYTQVTFYPDFPKFGMEGLDSDIVRIMKRRAYDIAGCTHKDLSVRLNGTKLPVRSFVEYVALYPFLDGEVDGDASDVKKRNELTKGYARIGDRWEVAVRVSNIGFQQVSFVNSIATARGGTHVNAVVQQLLDKVSEAATKKRKDLEIKPFMIKPHIWVFINCLIENPSFDSQTKDTLNTVKSKFGSTCELPPALIEWVVKSPIVQRTLDTANSKVTKEMMDKLGKGGGRVRDAKLRDATGAGREECTLILTEGDSAKTLAVNGVSSIRAHHRFGVFALRGKLLNVREASTKKILENDEIQKLIKIIGLRVGDDNPDPKKLRYQHVMIMTDQDTDGSHIKGLVINFFHNFWPNLLRNRPDFVRQMITPIVKAMYKFDPNDRTRENDDDKHFFSIPAFLEWKRSLTEHQLKDYTIKYYKGLGTSTDIEARDYFERLTDHCITFDLARVEDEDRICLAFAKERVDDRKDWITSFNPTTAPGVDYSIKHISYQHFVDEELVLFSIADCERSIPSMVDGFKPGQRKVLYACFLRNLRTSLKVAQLAGYVAEKSAYHHGEASLTGTIINMAQDFVGANNIPLLVPDGQFGTRAKGGKDAASARYIQTYLDEVTRSIFIKDDDNILKYRDDDGFPVEPHFYIPIIPMVLVNGTSGIGTGFATCIPNHSPFEIIENLRKLLHDEEVTPMKPWYHGFRGEIQPVEQQRGKFVARGRCEVGADGVINISELPIGTWSEGYVGTLADMLEQELVLDMRDRSDRLIDIDVALHPAVLRSWQAGGKVEEKLGLRDYLHATNLICFDANGTLRKYDSAEAILREFYKVRLHYYGLRHAYLVEELRYEIRRLSNVVRFLREVVDGRFVVTRKPKAQLLQEIIAAGYDPFPPRQKRQLSATAVVTASATGSSATRGRNASAAAAATGAAADDDDDDDPLAAVMREAVDRDPTTVQRSRDYDYLLGLKIWNLTLEMVQATERQLQAKQKELETLLKRTPKELWLGDLERLEKVLRKSFQERESAATHGRRKRRGRGQGEAATTRTKAPDGRLPMPKAASKPLGEKAAKLLAKEEEKDIKKTAVRVPRAAAAARAGDAAAAAGTATPGPEGAEDGAAAAGGAAAVPRAPRRPAAKRAPAAKPRAKKKRRGSDDESSDTSSDESGSSSAESSSDSPPTPTDSDNDAPKPPTAPKRAAPAAKRSAPTKRAGSGDAGASVKKAARTEVAHAGANTGATTADPWDVDAEFGLEAAESAVGGGGTFVPVAPAAKAAVAKPPPKPRAKKPATAALYDDDDEINVLLERATPVPQPTASVRPAPAARRSPEKAKKLQQPKTKAEAKKKPAKRRRGSDTSSGSDSSSGSSSSASSSSDESSFDDDSD